MILCVWSQDDFFVLHYKYTYSSGETATSSPRFEKIERFDPDIPRISR